MLIDWFTVGAQALNFIVLVWLMKHFLYQPVLDAIDAREKRIAAQLADADTEESCRAKSIAMISRTRTTCLRPAARQRIARPRRPTKANAERQKLLDAARQAADALDGDAPRHDGQRCEDAQPGAAPAHAG